MANKYTTTLVIGDAHADPRFSNARFSALGNYIADVQPDNIVQIGDFGNLDSISFHNKGKPLVAEGLRLSDDIASMQDAFEKMMSPIEKENSLRTKWKKKKYSPNIYWFNGNHEDRTWRYIQDKPELAGFIPTTDLVGATERGCILVPYREYVFIEGVGFTHIPMNPNNNQPIGGKYVCSRAAEGQQQTVVFGHVHHRSVHSINRNSGNSAGTRIDGISAGCFFDYNPDYVRGNEGQLNWWRGLVLLHHVSAGEVDIETIHIDRVKKIWG